MADLRISQDVTEFLVGWPEASVTQDVTEYLYSEFGAPEIQLSQDVIEYLYLEEEDAPPLVATVDCNFGSAFVQGVLRGQGTCA